MIRLLKGILKFILITIAVCVVGLAAFVGYLMLGKQSALELPINGVDLSSVSDGTYTGSYDSYRWSNTVEVTVENHTIVNIEVVTPQQIIGEETVKSLISGVMSTQNTDIDAVAGATASSKAFLYAVENALSGTPAE